MRQTRAVGRALSAGALLFVGFSLGVAGPGRAEDSPSGVLSQSAKLKAYRKPLDLRRRYVLPDDTIESDAPVVREAKMEGVGVLFVDVDGNGAFDDAGTDAWALARAPTRTKVRLLLPVDGTLVLGGSTLRYRFASDGKRVEYESRPMTGAVDHVLGVAKINELRMQNGLPPVTLDPELSQKCAKHVAYMVNNDAYGHTERPGAPGYSEEGAEAGLNSIIDRGVTLEQAAERWFATLFHRRPLTDPRVAVVGAGTGGKYAMCYPRIDSDTDRWQWPVLVPAPGSANQPTRAGREQPLPFPEGTEPGYPITIQFPAWNSAVTKVDATLRERTEAGKRVPAILSAPESPAHASRRGNDGCICLIPREPLGAKRTYFVRVRFRWNGKDQERAWTFTTGPDRRPPGQYAR